MKHQFTRTYQPWIEETAWVRRSAWAADGGDVDPELVTHGAAVTLSGSRGDIWLSGAVPVPLDHDTLRLTLSGTITNGRAGVEWCHAKKGKYHPIVWADSSEDGRFRLDGIPAVPTTASFRIAVEALTGGDVEVSIDECAGALTPHIDVLVNQVGYDLGAPMRFTVQANGPFDDPATYRLIAPIAGPGREFECMREGTLEPAGDVSEWGRWYWRGDLTGFEMPGNFYIEASIGGMRAESPVFSVGPNFLAGKTLDLAQRFFYWQRCGQRVPGWHEACHLDDRVTTESGVTIEAAGAWHDAGDYNKYNGFTPLSVYSLLYARERAYDLMQTWRTTGRDDVLDEALWGAEYLRKVQDPKTGALWGQHSTGYGYWGIPEHETDNRIGGDDDRVATGQSKNLWLVAAFAHLGQLLDNEEYTGRALAHWKLAYDPESQSVAHAAQTIFAAYELDSALSDDSFAETQASVARLIVSCQSGDERYDGWYGVSPGGAPAYAVVDNGLPGAALAHWVMQNPDHPFADTARESLRRYVRFLVSVSNNPLNIARAYTGAKDAWFYPFAKDGDWHVGQNSQYLSDAWAALLAYRVTGEDAALTFALDQIGWVLGRNPYSMCMLHGEGRINPVTAHHRYNMIVGQPQGAVPGSVYNGIVRFNAANDIPLWDLIPQGTPRYQCNEPWLPHNAYYLFAASELADIV